MMKDATNAQENAVPTQCQCRLINNAEQALKAQVDTRKRDGHRAPFTETYNFRETTEREPADGRA